MDAHDNMRALCRCLQTLLSLVAFGVDVIDCEMPVSCTRAHRALVFPLFSDSAQIRKLITRDGSHQHGSADDFIHQQQILDSPSPTDGASAVAKDHDDWKNALFSDGQHNAADGPLRAAQLRYSDFYGSFEEVCHGSTAFFATVPNSDRRFCLLLSSASLFRRYFR